MSGPSDTQTAQNVAETSQNAIPQPAGEGSAAAETGVPATLNEAGSLKPDADKSEREGQSPYN
jgi:hypothetical protein